MMKKKKKTIFVESIKKRGRPTTPRCTVRDMQKDESDIIFRYVFLFACYYIII